MCRSKNRQQNKNYSSRRSVNQIDDNGSRLEHRDSSNSSTDDEYIFGLREEVNKIEKKQPRLTVWINGTRVNILVDTGSSVNVIDEDTFQKIEESRNFPTSTRKFSHMVLIRIWN